MSFDCDDVYRGSGLYLGGLNSVGALPLLESFVFETV